MSAASIPGQEKLRGHSQLHFQNYSGRSWDRGRARRGRIPQGRGAHANFSASRSFACTLCTARQRENGNHGWEPECIAVHLFALLPVTRGRAGVRDSSPVKAGLHVLMWNRNWDLWDAENCAVAAVSQVALTASAKRLNSKAAHKFCQRPSVNGSSLHFTTTLKKQVWPFLNLIRVTFSLLLAASFQ